MPRARGEASRQQRMPVLDEAVFSRNQVWTLEDIRKAHDADLATMVRNLLDRLAERDAATMGKVKT